MKAESSRNAGRNTDTCPSDESLVQVVAGTADAQLLGVVTRHLDQCPTCCERLDAVTPSFPGDSLTLSEASARAKDSQVVDRLQELSAEELGSLVDTSSLNNQNTVVPFKPSERKKWEDLSPWLEACDPDDGIAKLGEFVLTKLLGRGGMGVVFLAEDQKLGREVAIKVLSPSLAHDEDARNRFRREARAIAKVQHPCIVNVFQVVDDADLPYIVMEYVKGRSLDQVLAKHGRLSSKQTARVAKQVAAALNAAHAAGLIHRDVKPANVLIESGTGRAKLTDFGLVRGANDITLTQTGSIIGTPAYICLLYTSPSPRDRTRSRMPSSA